MHDHDPDDAEMRAWLADGKAPAGVCPHCGSRISVVQRDGWFRARCSHRRCGASGPRMATLVRAVEQFCAPPAYVARHMGISVQARAEQAEAERDALGSVAVYFVGRTLREEIETMSWAFDRRDGRWSAVMQLARRVGFVEQALSDLAEHDCSYGDGCPSNAGTRHGTCDACKARKALDEARRRE